MIGSSQENMHGASSEAAKILQRNGIEAEAKTEQEAPSEQDSFDSERIANEIGAHVNRCWHLARTAKEQHTNVLLHCLRQREGIYAPEKLQAIREQGGSEIFMLLTQLKIRAAKAWIMEVMFPKPGELPFEVKPSPKPTLPKNIQQIIRENIKGEAQQALQMGLYPTPEKIRERTEKVVAQVMSRFKKWADERARRMGIYLKDQLHEAGWRAELEAFIDDFLTYPVAFLKGPYNVMGNEMAWQFQPDGTVSPKVERAVQRRFKCVSPFDAYPAPDSRDVNDGYFIEVMKVRRKQLYDMIGLDGYDEDALRAVINEYGDKGHRLNRHNETERDRLEGRDHDEWSNDVSIEVINFWGELRGKWLIDWGVPASQIPDPDDDYEANVMMVGPHVFRAALNRHPLGKRPYESESLERANNMIFGGKGLAQIISDLQDMCNASARSLANNMALASGPMVEIQVDRLAQGETVTDIIPWRQFQTTESKVGSGSGGRAINFFQPNSNANELMQVYKFFAAIADEYSGIPPYSMGNNVSGGAASTASGLGMLIEGAARGVKLAVAGIDRVIEHSVTQTFNSVMMHDNVPEIKGDLAIKAIGSKGILNKEQANMRRMDLFNILVQPQVLQTIGPEAMVDTLREMYEGFNLDPSHLPDQDKLLQMLMQRAQQAQAQAEAEGGGSAPRENRQQALDGAVAGGAEAQIV